MGQKGTQIAGTTTIPQSEETWELGAIVRKCDRVEYAAWPSILDDLETAFPLDSKANDSYPYVVLQTRTVERWQRNPSLARVELHYEQTEQDPNEEEDVPDDVKTESSRVIHRPIGEHPEVKAIGDMWVYYDPDRRQLRGDADVPAALRFATSYPVTLREIRITEFAATEFDPPETNVREIPTGESGEGKWLVTAGDNGKSGRWFTQTRVFSYDPDGHPDEIWEQYES